MQKGLLLLAPRYTKIHRLPLAYSDVFASASFSASSSHPQPVPSHPLVKVERKEGILEEEEMEHREDSVGEGDAVRGEGEVGEGEGRTSCEGEAVDIYSQVVEEEGMEVERSYPGPFHYCTDEVEWALDGRGNMVVVVACFATFPSHVSLLYCQHVLQSKQLHKKEKYNHKIQISGL